MKIFILSVSFIISLTLHAQKKELSMDSTKGVYVNGVYLYLDQNGEPFSGILYARHPNGNMASRQNFSNGIGMGTWINYHENGMIKEKGTYDRNKVKGPIKKYNEEGQLIAEGTYDDWRVRVGQWIYYDHAGHIILTEDYGLKGDYRDVKEYYDTGQISENWYNDIMKRKEVYID